MHPDGGVWFTDPGYGSLGHYEGHLGDLELPTRVYRLDPEKGSASVVDESLEKPNGLAFSPTSRHFTLVIQVPPIKTGIPGRSMHLMFLLKMNCRVTGFFVILGQPCLMVFEWTFLETFGLVPAGQDQGMTAYRFLLRTAPRSEQYICLKEYRTYASVELNGTDCSSLVGNLFLVFMLRSRVCLTFR